jgi:D-cysteine desulfhydrase
MMRPSPTPELFRAYPELRERLPWTGLARATQVHALERLNSFLRSSDGIWVKRDDESNLLFGGSQARKMEFLFGDALRSGRSRLLAFDRAGSGESVALCVFARHFQLQPLLALHGDRTSEAVQRTLDVQSRLGAEIHFVRWSPNAWWRLGRSAWKGARGSSHLPYIAWARKRRLFGTLGFVNAAFELRRQINIGLLPSPQAIYVGLETASLMAGLALGLELAGLDTRLVGVPSSPHRSGSPRQARDRAERHLRARCRRFPPIRGSVSLDLRRPTARDERRPGAQQAHALLRDLEGLDLGLSAAHTMAQLLEDARAGAVTGPVLFWNTHAGNLAHIAPTGSTMAPPGGFPESIATP